MPLVTLPIQKPFYNDVSDAKVMLVDDAHDCYYENTQEGHYCLRRRPGYSAFSSGIAAGSSTPATGQGIFWSDRLDAPFVVSGGKLYKLASDGVATELAGSTLNVLRRVIFAEGQDLALAPFIYIAHGGLLRYTNGTTLSALTDASAPYANYVVSLSNRFFADNGGVTPSQDMLITDTNPATGLIDPFYWSYASNPFRIAQKADLLKAMHSGWNEVSMWGTQTIEYWQEDGVTPVSPLMGATSEVGIEAPYSLVNADNTLFALANMNGKRAIIKMANRAPQIISADIDRELQKLTVVSDAVGTFCFAGGLNSYLIDFPTEKVTWVYDLKEGIWTKWGAWNSGEARYDSFPIAGSCYAKTWNKHLFLGTNGVVYQFSRDTFQDNGAEQRTTIRTGWFNHGSSRRKRSRELTVKVKAYNASPSTLLLRWRDDGRPEWSNYMTLPLGSESEQTHYTRLTSMGIYRSRQYEFVITDNVDLALMGMIEDVEELAN
jgi:hypothetical protein